VVREQMTDIGGAARGIGEGRDGRRRERQRENTSDKSRDITVRLIEEA
jgi:hypothetical protein